MAKHFQESAAGRTGRSVLALTVLRPGPYQIVSLDGERVVEVITANEESDDTNLPRSLLLIGSASQVIEPAGILEEENSKLKQMNRKLIEKNKELEKKNMELRNELLELKGKHESDVGLSYDELRKLNTVEEPAGYQAGQDSDASSVDEMTGQEPTLAELRFMNPVGD